MPTSPLRAWLARRRRGRTGGSWGGVEAVWKRRRLSWWVQETIVQDSNGASEDRAAEVRRYALVIEWSDEDQVFIASAPDLPGLRTHGVTREEAATMGEEAIGLWIGASRRIDRGIPRPASRSSPITRDPGDYFRRGGWPSPPNRYFVARPPDWVSRPSKGPCPRQSGRPCPIAALFGSLHRRPVLPIRNLRRVPRTVIAALQHSTGELLPAPG